MNKFFSESTCELFQYSSLALGHTHTSQICIIHPASHLSYSKLNGKNIFFQSTLSF